MSWQFRVNPAELSPAEHLRRLNASFGETWNERRYDWYLRRPFGDRRPDIVALYDGATPVAGAALNYRDVLLGDGRAVPIPIMSAGWTAPAVRRQGCFLRLISATCAHALRQGSVAMAGFFTAGGPSQRVFERLEGTLIECHYVHADPGEVLAPTGGLPVLAATADEGELDGNVARGGPLRCNRFGYPDAQTWRAQFVERPDRTQRLRVDAALVAVVEAVDGTQRLQWLAEDCDRLAVIRACARRAHEAGERFFAYSSLAGENEALRAAGFRLQPGFLGLLTCPATPEAISAQWLIHSGDRM